MSKPDQVEVLEGKIDRLTDYIYNDSRTGRKGLVQEVDEMKLQIQSIVNENNMNKARRVGFAAAWGMFGAGLIYLLKLLAIKIF